MQKYSFLETPEKPHHVIRVLLLVGALLAIVGAASIYAYMCRTKITNVPPTQNNVEILTDEEFRQIVSQPMSSSTPVKKLSPEAIKRLTSQK